MSQAGGVTNSPETTIRRAQESDRSGVLDVARASGLFPPPELAQIGQLFDDFLGGADAAGVWLVDHWADRVIAVAYCAPERMTNGTWNMFLLAVHPEQQGQGRGKALVRCVERELRDRGARLLLIETSGVPEFAGQRSFYAGLGYQLEAVIRGFYDVDDDKVVYRKLLGDR